MKIKISPGNAPASAAGRADGGDAAAGNTLASATVTAAADVEIDVGQSLANVALVDAELVDEFAAKLKVKIDNKVAKKAFLISLRQDFGQGSSSVDWADRMQAEINKQDNLRTHQADRRTLVDNDRRRKASED